MPGHLLTSKEWNQIARVSARFHQARSVEELVRTAMQDLPKFVPADHYLYGEFYRQKNSQVPHYFSDLETAREAERLTPVMLHYLEAYPQNARRAVVARKVINLSDAVPMRELESTGWIEQYGRPLHCIRRIMLYTSETDGFAGLSCGRNGRDYSAKEKTYLQALAPHFDQAYLNCRAWEEKEEKLAQAEKIQKALPYETIRLREDLGMAAMTPGAILWIKEFFGQQVEFQQLPDRLRDWVRAAQEQLKGKPLGPLLVRKGQALLRIRFYPEEGKEAGLLLLQRQRLEPTPEDLRPLGLSRRETEVLLWIFCGKTNREIGTLLFVNLRTIDWHVQAILAKLGVENRTAAALLVAELLNG